jgi:hypothetical protein
MERKYYFVYLLNCASVELLKLKIIVQQKLNKDNKEANKTIFTSIQMIFQLQANEVKFLSRHNTRQII